MTLYDLSAKLNNGRNKKLADYKGKVLLIVNTASKCGFTPQYEGLQSLYAKYKGRGFEVLGFPCDQFGHQEPGSDDEIKSFCQLNYGVKFPLFSKIEVNGPDNAHPVFQFLKSEEGRPAGRRHQVELHQVPGGQEGNCRRALRPHDDASDNRNADREVAREVNDNSGRDYALDGLAV